METKVFVYVDVNDAPRLAGSLWCHTRDGRQSATFRYAESWLSQPDRFALQPLLVLGPGPYHTSKALFGAIGDSAPDTWGRLLMGRSRRKTQRREGRSVDTLMEVDFLLRVGDEARQGALRFATEESGPFLSTHEESSVPPLVNLRELLSASENVISNSESDEELRLLLAPGSSLGGARPKASVRDLDGSLLIAKFPKQDDAIDMVRWEAVALELAEAAGLSVPKSRLEIVGGKPVLLVSRFDRLNGKRVPFLSAMAMLDMVDGARASYLDIADALQEHGVAASADIEELWRRIVFSIRINNTDDHLRNHAFLYQDSGGWRLSPVYDLNPMPLDINPPVLKLAIDRETTAADLELALGMAEEYGLTRSRAEIIVSEVDSAVAKWQKTATGHGLSGEDIVRMESAFERRDV